MPAQSALVILVPEAEGLVGRFRDRFDPSAAVGMPAHITLLFPFVAPSEIDAVLLDGLSKLFARSSPFSCRFVESRRFPDTLYLAPEPVEPFRALTAAIWNCYPSTPPYEGRFAEIIPHLTVGQFADEIEGQAVANELEEAARGVLPITALACEVSLMESTSGHWRGHSSFRLGGRPREQNER